MKNKKTEFYEYSQEDQRQNAGYSQSKIDFLLNSIGSNKKILDLGCNDGFVGEYLIRNKNDVYGCDIVEKNLKKAMKRGLNVKQIDIENEELSFESNFFDYVILGDILEHVFDTDSLLNKCKKIMKKDGKIIITTPNIASLGRRIMLLLGISPYIEFSIIQSTNGLPSVGHIRYFTKKTLNEILSANGFKNIRITSNAISFHFFELKFLGKLFPSLGRDFYAIAEIE